MATMISYDPRRRPDDRDMRIRGILRHTVAVSGARSAFDPSAITRPHERLMTYYLIVAVLTFVAFPVTLITLYIKYRTLHYRFDDEGVWRRQGLLWRREVNVAYRRIQDIHLTNGLIQRWLGLATVSIQTAAGTATPEISIEGVLEAEALRDFLYTKMRGVREAAPAGEAGRGTVVSEEPGDETLSLLTEIRDSLRRLEDRLGHTQPGS
jgi:putative membrane protein